MRTIRVAVLGMAGLTAACSGSPVAPSATTPVPSMPAASISAASASPEATSPAPTLSGDTLSGRFVVDDRDMFLECKGTGSPTVIVEMGLGGGSTSWAGTISELAATTRACRYDRAGIGFSDPHRGRVVLSAGDRADELRALLEVAGVEGPYVLAGFSYGGMIIRAFTDRFPNEIAGLVFIDSSHEEQFVPGGWWDDVMPPWTDGAHAVDLARSRNELLAAADLGARPTIVLTQGGMNGELERQWSPLQDALAAMSSTSLHIVATESGHDIRTDRPELVTESIRAVVEAARGTVLASCGPRFETLGAECLESTMVDLLTTWDALRDEVQPIAGKLPAGAYSFEESNDTITITIGKGRLEATMRHPDGTVESFSAEYAAVGNEVTFLWPFDWRIPRTSGLNTARWSADPNGTLHFVQIDSEQAESWLGQPWVPVAGG